MSNLRGSHGGPQKSPAPHAYNQARGVAGARARWGAPRIARLEDLTESERALVVALVEAARVRAARETAPAFEVPEAVVGGRRVSADDPAAA
jgi:hypothetical protein